MRRPADCARSLRARLVDRLDAAVLRRVRTLNERAGRGTGRRREEVLAVLASGVAGLTDPVRPGSEWPPAVRQAIIDQFHRLYYDDAPRTWQTIHYRGHGIWKCPLDLWMYQELVTEIRPGLIVETGTALGGSGLFLADLCELVGAGRVVTIDIRERAALVDHPRLTKLIGSSSDPAVFTEVAALARPANRCW